MPEAQHGENDIEMAGTAGRPEGAGWAAGGWTRYPPQVIGVVGAGTMGSGHRAAGGTLGRNDAAV